MPLWLTPAQAQQILSHARECAPQEACGLIAGTNGRVTEIVPVRNIATNPNTNFVMDPEEQAVTMSRFQRNNHTLMAIYHSHPNSPSIPSQTDIKNAAYPDTTHLIISLKHDKPKLAGWQITGPHVQPVEVHIGFEAPATIEPTSLSNAQRIAIIIGAIVACIMVIAYSIYLLPPAPPIPTPGG